MKGGYECLGYEDTQHGVGIRGNEPGVLAASQQSIDANALMSEERSNMSPK
jgi:hypothetical protein